MEAEDSGDFEYDNSTAEDTEHELERLEGARRDNDFKLKRRFEDLFVKYEHDFTGIGDEIDLVTGEIVVNNGHLENMRGEVDPGNSESANFLKSLQIIESDSTGEDAASDDESATTHSESEATEDEILVKNPLIRELETADTSARSLLASTGTSGQGHTRKASTVLSRPAPRLAALFATRKGITDRTTRAPIAEPTRQSAFLQTPKTPVKRMENRASKVCDNVGALEEPINMLRSRTNGEPLDSNNIQDLGIAIANQLAQILSGQSKQEASRPLRRPAAREKLWDCPEPGETPFPVTHRGPSMSARHLTMSSPGGNSLWAPTARSKKRKLSHGFKPHRRISSQHAVSSEDGNQSIDPVAARSLPRSSEITSVSQNLEDETQKEQRRMSQSPGRFQQVDVFPQSSASQTPAGPMRSDVEALPQTDVEQENVNANRIYPANTSRHRNDRPKSLKVRFTPEEDALIISLREHQNIPWMNMSEYFTGRTSMALQNRYSTKLKDSCEGRTLLASQTVSSAVQSHTGPTDGTSVRGDDALDADQHELLLESQKRGQAGRHESGKAVSRRSTMVHQSPSSARPDLRVNMMNEENLDPRLRTKPHTNFDSQTPKLHDNELAYTSKSTIATQRISGEEAVIGDEGFTLIEPAHTLTTEDEAHSDAEHRTAQMDSLQTNTCDANHFTSDFLKAIRKPRYDRYTQDEDDTIKKMRLSNRTWKEIAAKVPSRNLISIKNRYEYLRTRGDLDRYSMESLADGVDCNGSVYLDSHSDTGHQRITRDPMDVRDDASKAFSEEEDAESPDSSSTHDPDRDFLPAPEEAVDVLDERGTTSTEMLNQNQHQTVDVSESHRSSVRGKGSARDFSGRFQRGLSLLRTAVDNRSRRQRISSGTQDVDRFQVRDLDSRTRLFDPSHQLFSELSSAMSFEESQPSISDDTPPSGSLAYAKAPLKQRRASEVLVSSHDGSQNRSQSPRAEILSRVSGVDRPRSAHEHKVVRAERSEHPDSLIRLDLPQEPLNLSPDKVVAKMRRQACSIDAHPFEASDRQQALSDEQSPSDRSQTETADLRNEVHEIARSSNSPHPLHSSDPKSALSRLVKMAFEAVGAGPLRMNDVVCWIEANHPWIANGNPRWKMSLRSMLTMNPDYQPTTIEDKRAWIMIRKTASLSDECRSPANSDNLDLSVEPASIEQESVQHEREPFDEETEMDDVVTPRDYLHRRRYRRRRVLSEAVIDDSEDEATEASAVRPEPDRRTPKPTEHLEGSSPIRGVEADTPAANSYTPQASSPFESFKSPIGLKKVQRRDGPRSPEIANSQSTAPSSSGATISATAPVPTPMPVFTPAPALPPAPALKSTPALPSAPAPASPPALTPEPEPAPTSAPAPAPPAPAPPSEPPLSSALDAEKRMSALPVPSAALGIPLTSKLITSRADSPAMEKPVSRSFGTGRLSMLASGTPKMVRFSNRKRVVETPLKPGKHDDNSEEDELA